MNQQTGKTVDTLLNSSKKQTFPAMLEQFKGEIAKALPKHLSADRMARIALTEFRRTPKLAQCDPRSVFAAVIQSSQLGLEPGPLGRSFLIPYGSECSFIPGWKGLVDLVNRAGNASVWTGAVFQGDEFDYALGDRPFVMHRPGSEDDEDKLEYVYAVGRVKGSEWPVIEVWPVNKIKKHRDKYNKVGKKHYSYTNFEMYARKVALLQVLKYMPASPELAQAISLNHAGEQGSQHLTIKDAIDGTWAPVEEDSDEDTATEDNTKPKLEWHLEQVKTFTLADLTQEALTRMDTAHLRPEEIKQLRAAVKARKEELRTTVIDAQPAPSFGTALTNAKTAQEFTSIVSSMADDDIRAAIAQWATDIDKLNRLFDAIPNDRQGEFALDADLRREELA